MKITNSSCKYSIFNACLNWAKAECFRQNIEASTENLRKVLRRILFEIRFPTMNQEDFAMKVVPLNILTKDESMQVLMYWVSNRKLTMDLFTAKQRKDKKRYFLIVGANVFEHNNDAQNHIMSAAEHAYEECKVDIMDAREITPTMEQIHDYDAILVYSNYSFHDPVALGDLLAQYIDSGMGGVVICAFGNYILHRF